MVVYLLHWGKSWLDMMSFGRYFLSMVFVALGRKTSVASQRNNFFLVGQLSKGQQNFPNGYVMSSAQDPLLAMIFCLHKNTQEYFAIYLHPGKCRDGRRPSPSPLKLLRISEKKILEIQIDRQPQVTGICLNKIE